MTKPGRSPTCDRTSNAPIHRLISRLISTQIRASIAPYLTLCNLTNPAYTLAFAALFRPTSDRERSDFDTSCLGMMKGESQFCKFALIPQPLLPKRATVYTQVLNRVDCGKQGRKLRFPRSLLSPLNPVMGFRVRATKVGCTR